MVEDGGLCLKRSTHLITISNDEAPCMYLFKAVLFKVFKPKDVQDSNPQGVV